MEVNDEMVAKEKFVAAGSSETLRSPTRTGKPAREPRGAWQQPDSPGPLPMPLRPMLVGDPWSRTDAPENGQEGALALESLFIGQAAGSFSRPRPAADITSDLATDRENRLAELGKLTHDRTTA